MRTPSRDSYERVATSEGELVSATPSRAGTSGSRRWGRLAIVISLGLLALYYVSVEVRSAASSHAGGKREISLIGRYEKHKLVSENAALRDRLKQLQDTLRRRESGALERAKQEARAMEASASQPAAGGSAAPASVQQVLSGALGRAGANVSGAGAQRGQQQGKQQGPGAGQHLLTKQLIRSRCNEHNIILVTFVNGKRADYAFTWVAHVRRLKLSNYLVGAMDGVALKLLLAQDVATFDMASGLSTLELGWGTKNFRKLGLRKTELIISLLRAGADPILTDADALVTRDPTPFVVGLLPEAQILVTSDHLTSTTERDGQLEEPTRASASAWNIGYFYIRHDTLPAILHWQARCEANPTLWDQNLFKDVLKIGGLRYSDPKRPEIQRKRLLLGYNGTVAIGILPISTFCSGHTYFVQRMPQRLGVEPYSVHTTFQYSGAVGKTHRLREAMLWEDAPSYFDPPQGLLAYKPYVRRELILPSGKMTTALHFRLVHEQLTQFRAAAILARKLNRLLILPPFVCGLDRFWAPHNGTIPGSRTTLPIEPCPADHVIDLEHIARAHHNSLLSLFREHSFLSNPRLPASVRASVSAQPPPADLSDASIAPLAKLGTVRVLSFDSMPDLYASLPSVSKEAEQRRMETWTSIWCCSVPPGPRKPGHIWYDLFWDVVPHTNRFRKRVEATWEPNFGP